LFEILFAKGFFSRDCKNKGIESAMDIQTENCKPMGKAKMAVFATQV